MAERIYISYIQSELRYKDRRSVRRWCRNNIVRIFSDIGSNKQYVLKDEFEMAKNRNSLINIFSQNRNNNTEKKRVYKPQGEYEKAFLSIFTNIIQTL